MNEEIITPKWCDEGQPASPDRPILSMRLKPHRSLTQRSFRLLLIIFAAASLFSSLPFILFGAWPVAGFLGLDVLALYLAFKANFRSARAYEDVFLTPFELRFAKINAEGARAEWRFNPVWVRLDRIEHEEFGIQRLAFVSRGHNIEIGPFLGPQEKAQLALNLSSALAEARRGPRFSQ